MLSYALVVEREAPFFFVFFFFFNDTATTEIYTLSLHDALPIHRLTPAAHPGCRALIEIPPDTRYRSGMNGSTPRTSSDGNSRANRSRSRAKTIQGSAVFAPESGPDAANSHRSARGSNGSWWRRVQTRRASAVFQGSIMRIAPPGRSVRAASRKNAPTSGTWCRTSVMTIALRPPSTNGSRRASATVRTPSQGNTSDVTRPGMYSARNPGPEPSSSTGSSPAGNDVTIQRYQSS